MKELVVPPMPSLIPEEAPFTPAQRAWLNGFFAALMAREGAGVTPLSESEGAGAFTKLPASIEDDDDAPWHDPALNMAERMKLAEGRPLRRRMMAAMAQQDCGQCGYNCADYAEALFNRKETRLNLCVPGGKETARALKTLYAEMGAPPSAPPKGAPPSAESVQAQSGYSRDRPVEAVLLSRRRLNKAGSAKDTWHIEFDLSGTGLAYAAGDSCGVFPVNDPGLVNAIIAALDAQHETPIAGRPLFEVLSRQVSLWPAPDSLFQLLSYLTGGAERAKAKALAAGEDPDGDAASLDVLDTLKKFPSCRPHPEAFVDALEPLQPRLYSISSSPKVDPNRLSLTVDAVRFSMGNRLRLGAASTFLIDRLKPGARAPIYVQKAHNFGLPADPATPIIMIGPGTGIAPFRAFLQERQALGAPGRNWLFFGHQRSAYDFFYKDELAALKESGVLTRLSLAWSRDGEGKFYVQDRMREVGRELWAWVAEGAHIYVCGDAKHMAKDVEGALVEIVAAHGARSTEEALAFVASLKKSGRYQADVY
jgi:sulfite reductase (NADPH) flavoprotein alpha-component